MPRPQASDLFNVQLERAKTREAPLAARMRPRTFEEFVGQEAIIGAEKVFRKAIERGVVGSLILYGPPGVGKTTLAEIIARKMEAQFEPISAVTSGIPELRSIIEAARQRRKFHPSSPEAPYGSTGTRNEWGAFRSSKSEVGQASAGLRGTRTVLLVDEIHRFNKAQQDVLLPVVEDGTLTLIGVTTENPYFEVIKALVSRSQVYQLMPLTEEHVRMIIDRALRDPERGLGGMNLTLQSSALEHLARMSGGDARIALNALELAAAAKGPNGTLDLHDIEDAMQTRAFKYDQGGDEHYDTISAFIKSMRGSDPDAALFWLHKMLAAGEDPEFIARRMIIFASEDVGNADSEALVVATSAAHALEWVGLPEAEYALSHAALYLASVPKSDAVKRAMSAVKSDLHRFGQQSVPPHLKNAPIPDMKRHPSTSSGQAAPSVGYQNPHASPGHVVEQQYLPDALKDRTYYEPTEQGAEKDIKKRVDAARRIIRKQSS